MIILLKVILALLLIADIFAVWSVWKDFQATRKQEGYDELSIWRRVRFNLTMFFMMTGMVSLFVFLLFFIFSNLSIS